MPLFVAITASRAGAECCLVDSIAACGRLRQRRACSFTVWDRPACRLPLWRLAKKCALSVSQATIICSSAITSENSEFSDMGKLDMLVQRNGISDVLPAIPTERRARRIEFFAS